jgi:hypothetical protein
MVLSGLRAMRNGGGRRCSLPKDVWQREEGSGNVAWRDSALGDAWCRNSLLGDLLLSDVGLGGRGILLAEGRNLRIGVAELGVSGGE